MPFISQFHTYLKICLWKRTYMHTHLWEWKGEQNRWSSASLDLALWWWCRVQWKNVSLKIWSGWNHMKITQCRRMAPHGVWRIYWSCPGRPLHIGWRPESELDCMPWFVRNEIKTQSPRRTMLPQKKSDKGACLIPHQPYKNQLI